LGSKTKLPTSGWQVANANWDWSQGDRTSWQWWCINNVHDFDEKIIGYDSSLCSFPDLPAYTIPLLFYL
jgi:hypothetical protein